MDRHRGTARKPCARTGTEHRGSDLDWAARHPCQAIEHLGRVRIRRETRAPRGTQSPISSADTVNSCTNPVRRVGVAPRCDAWRHCCHCRSENSTVASTVRRASCEDTIMVICLRTTTCRHIGAGKHQSGSGVFCLPGRRFRCCCGNVRRAPSRPQWSGGRRYSRRAPLDGGGVEIAGPRPGEDHAVFDQVR